MGKIKRVWNENKVLLVLAIVLIACIGIIVGVAIIYGYGSKDSDFNKKVNINEKVLTDVETNIKNNENVKNVSARLDAKIIYINIEFTETTKLDDAKKIAETSLTSFSEDDLKVCDIQFIITNGSGYTLMGARNKVGHAIVWGNYNTDYLKEEKDKNEKK